MATNRRILDAAQAVGIKAMISDDRMPNTTAGDGRARLDAIINDYRTHPALGGYVIADEPPVGAFPGLGSVVAYLRAQDPGRLAYINIFPNYADPQRHLGGFIYNPPSNGPTDYVFEYGFSF